MPILPISSLNALVTTVVKRVSTHVPKGLNQRHFTHYLLKGVGNLPTPLLERLNRSLNAPTAAEYPHADAHLRLIFGVNRKLKQPLQLNELLQLRQKFATDMVEMQSPKVWQQAGNNGSINNSSIKNSHAENTGVETRVNKKADSKNKVSSNHDFNTNADNKEKPYLVNWQDKTIANADGDNMTVRCYQAANVEANNNDSSNQETSSHENSSYEANSHEASEQANPDKVVMLFFHGGGFCLGDINTHHEFCHTVCAQTGWALVSVDYRLAPEHPAPTAIRDCIAAYIWLVKHAHNLDCLPSRIVLAGDSAGGCLAALVAQQVSNATATPLSERPQYRDPLDTFTADIFQQLQDLARPLAQLSLYPVTDARMDYPSWTLYGEGLLLDYADVLVFDAAYMQHSPLSHEHVLISPMFGDNQALCPSYIVAAELDVLRDEALAYAEQLQNYGIEVQTHTVLGAPHGFINLMSVHRGLGRETAYIINDFAVFVRQLMTE